MLCASKASEWCSLSDGPWRSGSGAGAGLLGFSGAGLSSLSRLQARQGPVMAGNKDATCILDVPAIPADTFRPTGGASRYVLHVILPSAATRQAASSLNASRFRGRGRPHGRIRPAKLRPFAAECSRAISELRCHSQGRGSNNLSSSSLPSCPPPSSLLSERPNILAFRSSRKAAAELFARRSAVHEKD